MNQERKDDPESEPNSNVVQFDPARDRPLSPAECRAVRDMLESVKWLKSDFQIIRQCCPVARNIFRLPSD